MKYYIYELCTFLFPPLIPSSISPIYHHNWFVYSMFLFLSRKWYWVQAAYSYRSAICISILILLILLVCTWGTLYTYIYIRGTNVGCQYQSKLISLPTFANAKVDMGTWTSSSRTSNKPIDCLVLCIDIKYYTCICKRRIATDLNEKFASAVSKGHRSPGYIPAIWWSVLLLNSHHIHTHTPWGLSGLRKIKREHVDSWLSCHLSSSEKWLEMAFLFISFIDCTVYADRTLSHSSWRQRWFLWGCFSPRFEKPTWERVRVRQSSSWSLQSSIPFYGEFRKPSTPVE